MTHDANRPSIPLEEPPLIRRRMRLFLMLFAIPVLLTSLLAAWYFTREPGSIPPDTFTAVDPTMVRAGEPSVTTATANLVDLFSGGYTPTRATINGHTFNLEVANDRDTRAQGLSRRRFLAENAGMLFVFPTEGFHRFWMKEVPFPLDLTYINSDGVIVDVQTMKAEPGVPDADLTIYEPPVRVLLALEILGGKAQELGLEVGGLVQFE